MKTRFADGAFDAVSGLKTSPRFVACLAAVASLQVSACRPAPPELHSEEPSHVEHIDGSDLAVVTITEKAAERIGLETAEVFSRVLPRSSSPVTCVPYSALLYDPEGRTWVYASDKPLTFVREPVVVDYIDGSIAVLSSGPAVGTVVASVGVAELYGTEFEVGH